MNRVRLRLSVVALMLLVVASTHWLTPTDVPHLHTLHVVMRKMFLVPVIFAAVWFGMRGALVAAGVATALYLPHVVYQWAGNVAENVNQIGEISTVWLAAALAGILVAREKKAEQRELDANRGALRALVGALDARERETERHSVRVAVLSERLGRELGLDQTELEVLKIGALLHDIGKIGVPDEVLLGEGPLSVDAQAAMRRHPEIGLGILRPVPALRAAAEVVGNHHERYDGFGYPRRLVGSQIPLPARIFSVVDAFDAMTAGRPYREAIDLDSARQMISEERSRQFDPDVVDAFLRIRAREWRDLGVGEARNGGNG